MFYTDLLVETELRELIYKITKIDIAKDLQGNLNIQYVNLLTTNVVS